MAQAYIRQSTFSDGDTITAALFNNEYNQLVNAFAYSSSSASNTGHRHDGTAGQGGNIFKIGDLDFLNKVEIDSTNNRVGFYVEVSSAAVEQLRIQDGALVPVTDSDIDLGTTSLRFKDTFTDSITTTGNVDVGGNLTVTGTTTFNGGTITMGDANTDNVVFGADVDSSIIPDDDDTYDLGSSSQEWRNLFIDGTANIDSLVADTADINGGTIDGAVIGGSSAAAITGTAITGTSFVIGSADISEAELETIDGITAGTVAASKAIVVDSNKDFTGARNITLTGELDAGSLDVSGDVDVDGTLETDALSINGTAVTSTAAELNILDGVTATAAEINALDGITSTVAELNILDGVTASAADINLIDGITNGTVIASKAIITDANKDITGGRNITISGELDAATLDISGDADIDGTLEADAITIGGITLAETISDTVGAMVSSNTESNITVTYEDSDNTLDFALPAALEITTSVGVGGGSTNGVVISQGAIAIKNGGTQSYIDFYCESSNAHYARLQAPAHGSFSGNPTITLPATAGTIALTSSDITGNAATATALATARTIGGTSFDGTANISVGLADTATALANARTIHGVSFDGTANIDLTEVIQDTVGAMVSSNTESNITVTYEDSDGTLDFSVTGGGSVSEAFKTISVSGQDDVVADAAADTLTLVAGSNMTITTSASGDTITFASSGGGGSQNLFSTIAVSGQSNVVADSTTDTLTLVAGSGMTLTTDASGDSITFASSGSGNSVGNAFTKNTFTGDGSTTAFTLSISASNEDNLLVFIDGVYQADNVYTVSGTTLTFATAPVNSRVIEVFTVEAGIVGSAPVIDTMTGDGSDTTLALSTTPSSENQTFVTIDGVVQHKDTYAVSGSTLTFSAAPPTGTKVECITFTNVAVTTFQDADGDTKIQVEESSDEDKIRFDTGGSERMIIDGSGSVLIGSTTSIASNIGLQVTGTDAAGFISLFRDDSSIVANDDLGGILFYGDDNSATTQFASIRATAEGTHADGDNPTALRFLTTSDGTESSAERMRIDSSGNVGIGETSPDRLFHVKRSDSGGTVAKFENSAGTVYLELNTNNQVGGDSGYIGYNSSKDMLFLTDDTERIRIASGGALMIGTTSDVGTSGARVEILNVSSGGRLINTKDVGSSSCNHITFNNSNGQVGRITTSGSATAYVTSSDYRMKENLVYDWDAISKVKNLKPAQFNFKTNTDEIVEGFIAHEAQSVVPYAIVGEKDGEEMQGMDYSKLTAILTKAIQEQQTIIDNLTTRIETLEGGE